MDLPKAKICSRCYCRQLILQGAFLNSILVAAIFKSERHLLVLEEQHQSIFYAHGRLIDFYDIRSLGAKLRCTKLKKSEPFKSFREDPGKILLK